jgi:hypothetical protein
LDRAKTDITERLKDLTNQIWNFQNEIIVKNEKQSVEIVFDTKLVLKVNINYPISLSLSKD